MRTEDWGRPRFPESSSDSLSKVNPRYNENAAAWSDNCQRCVPAYEMRRRGYDVSAIPYAKGDDYLCYHPYDVWKDPIVHNTPGSGREAIESAMASYGDGARAQVTLDWNDSEGGHTFIAERNNGKTSFIDPQTGDKDVGWYFDHAAPGKTQFARIDNLTPSDRIFNCCANSQANLVNYDQNGNKIGNFTTTVPAQDIDMSTARGMPSTHFWNRRASENQFWENHGADKAFYMDQAKGIPEVQAMLSQGKDLNQIRADYPYLRNTVDAYYDPSNMIQVNRDANGNCSFVDDGKHRILAARELGYDVPVNIANDQMPSNAESAAPVGKTPQQIQSERFQDGLLSFSSQAPAQTVGNNNSNSDNRPGIPERERDIVAERQDAERGYRAAPPLTGTQSASSAEDRNSMTLKGATMNGSVVDPNTGNITSNSNPEITKGNHKGMPSRTDAYRSDDDRGHIQASSLGGNNDSSNVVPQNRDVNRRGYRDVERGETAALKNGASIDSTKTAYVGGNPDNRPSAFIVSDKVTYSDGHTEQINNSFTNESYADQDQWNQQTASMADTFDAPNPDDGLRQSMTPEEYAALMEATDSELPNLRDDYAPADYSGLPRENNATGEAEANGEGATTGEAEANGEEEGSDETEDDGEEEGSDETEGDGAEEDSDETEDDGEEEDSGETEGDGEEEDSGETEDDGEEEDSGETEDDGEEEGSGETEDDGEEEDSGETEDDGEEDSDETEGDGEEDSDETEGDGEEEGSDETEDDGEEEDSDETEGDGEEDSDETEGDGEEDSDETEDDGEEEDSGETEDDGKKSKYDKKHGDEEDSDEENTSKSNQNRDDGQTSDENGISDGEDSEDDENNNVNNGINDELEDEESEGNKDNGISDSEGDNPSTSDENGISDPKSGEDTGANQDSGISDGVATQGPSKNMDEGISGPDFASSGGNSQDDGMSQ